MLFSGSLLYMGWIKIQPAQKLLLRVKFTGNPHSYICERPCATIEMHDGYPDNAGLVLVSM